MVRFFRSLSILKRLNVCLGGATKLSQSTQLNLRPIAQIQFARPGPRRYLHLRSHLLHHAERVERMKDSRDVGC